MGEKKWVPDKATWDEGGLRNEAEGRLRLPHQFALVSGGQRGPPVPTCQGQIDVPLSRRKMGREDLKGHPSRVISGDCGRPERGSLSLPGTQGQPHKEAQD